MRDLFYLTFSMSFALIGNVRVHPMSTNPAPEPQAETLKREGNYQSTMFAVFLFLEVDRKSVV